MLLASSIGSGRGCHYRGGCLRLLLYLAPEGLSAVAANSRDLGVRRSLWLYKPAMPVSESMKSTVTPSIWGQAVLLVALET